MFAPNDKSKNIQQRSRVTFSSLLNCLMCRISNKWLTLLTLSTFLSLGPFSHSVAKNSTANLTIPIAIVVVPPAGTKSVLTNLQTPQDLAISGAQLGINDSNTTGRFLQQEFSLTIFKDTNISSIERQVSKWEKQHKGTIIAVGSDMLLSTLLTQKPAQRLILNAGNKNVQWRTNQCQNGLLHTIPSQAMLSDALAQYLILKQWRKWIIISSADRRDQIESESYQRSAKRFGGKIIAEKKWSFTTDLRRIAQQEVPALTQTRDYDVVIVSDANNQYGFYIPYNTWLPRPVAGSHGLTPVAWHHSIEQWGAAQLQNRFYEFSGRTMQNEDYAAWLAVRAIAEAVTRTKSTDRDVIKHYLLSKEFELAAFKGRKLTFRDFNGQLRQPIPLVQPNALVSQSPQQGFLHPITDLDTLGYDKPEVKCKMDEV